MEEDVEAGHGEVVDEAQEVDEEGERRGDRGDRAGDLGGDSEGAVDDGHEGLLPGRVERDVELTVQVVAGQLQHYMVLLDDVVAASEEIVLVVSVHAVGGGRRDGVLDAGGQVHYYDR